MWRGVQQVKPRLTNGGESETAGDIGYWPNNRTRRRESVSVCYMDPEDLKKLGIKEKTNVLVSTGYTRWSPSPKILKNPAGIIFISYGP